MRSTDLVARLRLDKAPFDQTITQAQTQLQGFSRTAGALPGGRNNVFGALAADAANLAPALSSVPLAIAAIGAALGGAGLAARQSGIEFQASLAKISTLGAEAKASLGETRQAILDTYSSTPVTGSVTDLAEANYLLQSSGRNAAEAMTDLNVAAQASVAGYTSVTTAVDGLTTVTNAWKDSQITTAQASDVLFSATNLGKASFEQIASSLGLVAPLAASAGVRFEEVAAATAVLSNQGIRTTSIMEGMRSAILNIQRPTEDFRRRYADLAHEFTASRLARDGIIKFLQDFDTASGGSRAALGALFSDATGLTTALGLLKNGGQDAAAALQQMRDASGATEKAMAEVTDTVKAQEQLIRNQIGRAWTEFGDLLNTRTLPILERVARVMNRVTDGAAFAQRDASKLIQLSGAEALIGARPSIELTPFGAKLTDTRRVDQEEALRSLIDQFTADRAQFLKALSRDELEKLGPELIRLRASGAYQQNSRTTISPDLINTVVDERLRRDTEAATDRDQTFIADRAARATAEARAKDERATSDREKAAARAKEEQAESERKAKELARQRQQIVDEAATLTDELQEQAAKALQGTAGALQSVMEQTLSKGAKMLASGVLSPERAAGLTAQLEQYEDLQQQMIAAEKEAVRTTHAIEGARQLGEKPALQAIGAREQELVVILKGTSNLAARAKIEEQLNALAAERGALTENVFSLPGGERAMQNTVAQMGDLAQSIATVGDQLGLLPKRAVDALRGIGALAEQGAVLSKGFSGLSSLGKIGGVVGIVGGIASLASSLFGESPEDVRAREAMLENTQSLRKLTERVGDLANSTLTGSQMVRARAALGKVGYGADGKVRNLTSVLQDSDVQAAAKELRIDLSARGSIAALSKALYDKDLSAYIDTFAGSMLRLDDTLRVDGVTDAVDIFRRRVAVLTDPKTGFPALAKVLDGIDISTVDGRTEAGTRARSLFDDLAAGKLTAAQLGGLSVNDARSVLVDFITGARDLTAGTGTGGFNESRSITEVTGSRLAGLLGSANTFLSSIAADVAALRASMVVSAPARLLTPSVGTITAGLGSGGSMITFASGAISISVTLDASVFGGGVGKALAVGEQIGNTIGKNFVAQIDQQLRERLLQRRLLEGDARLSQ